MEWKGIYFSLRPGMKREYALRHSSVPKELVDVLRRAGIRNYTIWNHGDMLFACYQVEDEARCEQVLAASETYQNWRGEMELIVYVEPGTGQKEWPMEQMFLME